MNTLQKQLENHTKNEYPPKYIFAVTTRGEVRTVPIEDIPSLSDSYNFVGMTDDNITYFKLKNAGNLPIIELKNNKKSFI